MKKSSFVLNVLMAALIVVGSAGLGHAGDLVTSGFVDITLPLTNEVADGTCGSPATPGGTTTNCTELQFGATMEVDFEKKQGPVTVRVDLDFPVTAGVGTGNNLLGAIITEQMRFDLAIPGGEGLNLNLTTGVFNSPIGFEAQDAPDLLQTTNGQLFALVPSNLAGLRLSGGNDMVSGSLIFVNDWNNTLPQVTAGFGEENSVGITLAVNPMPIVGLSFGYLSSAGLPTEDLINVIVSGTVMPSADLDLLYAVEFVSDEINDGLGITLNATHGKHGATIRYDMVETTGSAAEPTTLTVALLCQAADNLGVVVEWKSSDPDTAASATDALGLEFVATF